MKILCDLEPVASDVVSNGGVVKLGPVVSDVGQMVDAHEDLKPHIDIDLDLVGIRAPLLACSTQGLFNETVGLANNQANQCVVEKSEKRLSVLWGRGTAGPGLSVHGFTTTGVNRVHSVTEYLV